MAINTSAAVTAASPTPNTATSTPVNNHRLTSSKQVTPPDNSKHLAVLKYLSTNFNTVDTDKDGVLMDKELQALSKITASSGTPQLDQSALNDVISANSRIMFSNIEAGAKYWFGVTQADLSTFNSHFENSQLDFKAQVDAVSESIAKERGVADNQQAGLEAYIKEQRPLAANELRPSNNKPLPAGTVKDG